MRTLEKGYAGARKFCTVVNMPPPPTEEAFLSNSRVIGRRIKVGEEDFSGTESVNCGYSSRNGCVTVISMDTRKVLDVEALSQG